jgi:F-type H+-transporting ATPase subunit epsilon
MLTLTLVTPGKKILTDAAIDEVFVPSFKGELNILEGHAPLMSTLETGVLRYKAKGTNQYETVVISWGYLEVLNDQVTVLAETAEQAGEIDIERAQAAKAKAEKILSQPDIEQNDLQKYNLKLQRSLVRIGSAGGKPPAGHA